MNERLEISDVISGGRKALNRLVRDKKQWFAAVLVLAASLFVAYPEWKRNAELRSSWAAADRPKIERLQERRRLNEHAMHPDVDLSDRAKMIQARLKVWPADSPDRAADLNSLANELVIQQEYAKAARLYQEARNLLEKFLGANHPDVAVIDENVSESYTVIPKD